MYNTGTITTTSGSASVIGIGTSWAEAQIRAGDQLYICNDAGLQKGYLYNIASVEDNTHLTLSQTIQTADVATAGTYKIIQASNTNLIRDNNEKLGLLLDEYQDTKDAVNTTATGGAIPQANASGQISVGYNAGTLALCGTAASTQAKTATLDGFILTSGIALQLKFTYANTANSPTLSVNGTSAKAITYKGAAFTDIEAEKVYNLTYDGTNWEIELNYPIDEAKALISTSPCYYERSGLFVPAKTTIAMPTRLWCNINLGGYIKEAAETLDLTAAAAWDSVTTDYRTAANRAGKDFYIYACQNGTALKYVLSANSTVPTGYTVNTSRKIGGFHCLCADVGTISGHTLSGYVAGNILPSTVWDLKHRPAADPEGMAYISGLDIWADIYLASYSSGKLCSVYGGVTADGSSSPAFNGYKFGEYFGLIKKRPMWQNEFECASAGSNQLTNVSGGNDKNTTGGHVDTASRRMISNYGLEDCCGFLYQWGLDSAEATPGATWTSPNKYLEMTGYNDIVYESSIESSQGQCYGIPRRALFGGGWYDGALCGSRCSVWVGVPSRCDASFGCRGASEPLRVA